MASRDRAWIGKRGEDIAAAFLRSRGIVILARNHKSPHRGEVDIVARRGKLLLFIEVKTRRAGSAGRGLESVTRDKQALIERGANDWLRRLKTREIPWQFDVIEVIVEEGRKPAVRHIENAF